MVEHLLLPSSDPRFRGGVRPADEPSLVPIAVGLWVATFAVLVLPSFGGTRHRITEDHLLRAYSVAMTSFALL